MDERSTELESKSEEAPSSSTGAESKLFEEFWRSGAVATIDRLKQAPFATPVPEGALPSFASQIYQPWQETNRDQTGAELKALQKMLESTHHEISDLRNCLSNKDDEAEHARRALLTNPGKMMTASSGLAVLSKTPGLATMPLVGLAGLQGYDDFRNLLDSKSTYGGGKYALGLAADSALAAGSLAFLLEKVPAKFKSPLLIGGLVGRVALDLLPGESESEKK